MAKLREKPLRVTKAYAERVLRRATTSFRMLPGAMIIGGMRCGSSSAFRALAQHSGIAASGFKEVHFFDVAFHRGVSWYRSFFPFADDKILAMEATPSYMAHGLAASRAHSVVPDARVIALLRDPVERTWSHYKFRSYRGFESRTFAEIVEEETKLPIDGPPPAFSSLEEMSIIQASLYARQLRPWIEAFGRDHVIVVDADMLFESPDSVLKQLQVDLGLRPENLDLPTRNSSPKEPRDPGLMRELESYYEAPNKDLESLLGRSMSWSD